MLQFSWFAGLWFVGQPLIASKNGRRKTKEKRNWPHITGTYTVISSPPFQPIIECSFTNCGQPSNRSDRHNRTDDRKSSSYKESDRYGRDRGHDKSRDKTEKYRNRDKEYRNRHDRDKGRSRSDKDDKYTWVSVVRRFDLAKNNFFFNFSKFSPVAVTEIIVLTADEIVMIVTIGTTDPTETIGETIKIDTNEVVTPPPPLPLDQSQNLDLVLGHETFHQRWQ